MSLENQSVKDSSSSENPVGQTEISSNTSKAQISYQHERMGQGKYVIEHNDAEKTLETNELDSDTINKFLDGNAQIEIGKEAFAVYLENFTGQYATSYFDKPFNQEEVLSEFEDYVEDAAQQVNKIEGETNIYVETYPLENPQVLDYHNKQVSEQITTQFEDLTDKNVVRL